MEIYGMNIMVWVAILMGISLLVSLILMYKTSTVEYYTDDEVNWMNMELYDKQLEEATKVDETKLHIVPLNIADAPYESVQDNLKRHEQDKINRDKSGKFVKKTTALPTDYYGAKHGNNPMTSNMNILIGMDDRLKEE